MNISCVGIRTKNFHKNCYTRDNNQFVAENFLRVLRNNLQLSTVQGVKKVPDRFLNLM